MRPTHPAPGRRESVTMVLTTPSEVAAFLAERVMGWRLLDREAKGWGHGAPVWSTGDQRDSDDPTFQGFDPWSGDLRHSVMTLETWIDRSRGRSWLIEKPNVWLREDGQVVGNGMESDLRKAICRALCSALGAEVRIEEEEA